MTQRTTVSELVALDDETRERLEALLPVINEMADFYGNAGHPAPGSALETELEVLTTQSTVATIPVIGLNALDHLHNAAKSVLNAGQISAFSTFTLVRSAITAAGLGGWILAADTDQERQTRTLCVAYHETKNNRTAVREFVKDMPQRDATPENEHYNARRASALTKIEQLTSELDAIVADAIRIGLGDDPNAERIKKDIKEKPFDTTIIGAAAALVAPHPNYADFGAKREILRIWRTMSAHAHGLSWAARMSVVEATTDEGQPLSIWNPQGEDLLQGIHVAWDLLYGMMDRYIELMGRRPDREADAT
ncbi:hypothetical protein [Rhodococcus aetherivorans]|uniref:hypothetical protein n=1 Tax=Rhodococcus aetherivorans TaxID=191292 RepID=UPI001E5EB732|nr:hypothetical protein [Rhodococcus aetherivorans]UGQ43397.1 hypothetical protein LRQ66_09000 [Rhodococcus aetherivorans]